MTNIFTLTSLLNMLRLAPAFFSLPFFPPLFEHIELNI